MQVLSLETQTLYVEALERLRILDLERHFGRLAGGFARKKVGGNTFWYFRTSENALGRTEIYVGPDDPATALVISGYESLRGIASETNGGLERMAAMLRAGGCDALDVASGRVVQGLEAGGVFRLGGVLVGTHAYRVLGNVLGLKWRDGSRTQDPDVAAFRKVEIAAWNAGEVADVWGSLDALQMGFLPTPGLDPRSPHTSYFVALR
jgi:hypothetical protein